MADTTKKQAEALNAQNLLDFEQRVLNRCMYNAALAIGSSDPTKVKIATGTDANNLFSIEGVVIAAPSSQEIAFTATTDDIAPDATTAQEKTYLVMLDSGGTGSILGGDQAAIGKSVAPEPPVTKCVVGKVVLSIAAGTTKFDASTDLLSAGHITDTYTNLALLGH